MGGPSRLHGAESRLFLKSFPHQAQTGSESPQENEGRPALTGYSRQQRSHPHPVRVRPLRGAWLCRRRNTVSASARISECCAPEGSSQTQSKFSQLTRSLRSHWHLSIPDQAPNPRRQLTSVTPTLHEETEAQVKKPIQAPNSLEFEPKL